MIMIIFRHDHVESAADRLKSSVPVHACNSTLHFTNSKARLEEHGMVWAPPLLSEPRLKNWQLQVCLSLQTPKKPYTYAFDSIVCVFHDRTIDRTAKLAPSPTLAAWNNTWQMLFSFKLGSILPIISASIMTKTFVFTRAVGASSIAITILWGSLTAGLLWSRG